MKLAKPFIKLPVRFDVARLQAEVRAVSSESWAPHPNRHPGNSALRLITVNGEENDDVVGRMAQTRHLQASPYLQQVLASFGVVWSRSRLMQLAAGSSVPDHADINYHWFSRVRLHIPIITAPEVRFHCDGEQVHMQAGEAWLFDNWRRHHVDNGSNIDRIHLVADTSGSSQFWRRVAMAAETPVQDIPYRPGARASLGLERINLWPVMPPAELEHLLKDLLAETVAEGETEGEDVERFGIMIDGVCQDWRQLWSLFGDGAEGLPQYRRLLGFLKEETWRLGAHLKARTNGVAIPQIVESRVISFAAPGPAAPGPASPAAPGTVKAQAVPHVAPVRPQAAPAAVRYDRPIIIVAAPRSGSTALFETLAQSGQLWTAGGETHWLVEGFEQLRPGAPGVESNRLTERHLTPAIAEAVRSQLAARLRAADGRTPTSGQSVRLLEKTPKHALRIPFFDRIFPDARYVFLWRDACENVSSIIDAWRAGGWKTYETLPGWDGPWSLLLPQDWQSLRGKPLGKVAAHQWAQTNLTIMDDLQRLAPDRHRVVHYADFVRDPGSVIRDLCAFADIEFDAALAARTAAPLPASRHTLTAPAPDKWRKNAAEVEPVLPGLAEIEDRLRHFGQSRDGR